MIQRLYVHNFRCLENFDLLLADKSSMLLIGKNGTGKSTIASVLEVFQNIGRGNNQVSQLFSLTDFAQGKTDVPIRIEIEVLLNGVRYEYKIAVELSGGFKEIRIREERLVADGKDLFFRDIAQVNLVKNENLPPSQFTVNWYLVALPVIQSNSIDPIYVFKVWLAQMLILAPIPALIAGNSERQSLEPNRQATNYGDWFSGLIAQSPRAYSIIEHHVKEILHDMSDITSPVIGRDPRNGVDSRTLLVRFKAKGSGARIPLDIPFQSLSDGEKIFFIFATVLAVNQTNGPVFCFWDEPDNFISLDEVGHFIMALRRSFQSQGQFIATSHNATVVRHFSNENTLLLGRRSHQDPTRSVWLNEAKWDGDLVHALSDNEIEPWE